MSSTAQGAWRLASALVTVIFCKKDKDHVKTQFAHHFQKHQTRQKLVFHQSGWAFHRIGLRNIDFSVGE